MKYFVISDVHSCYDKMVKALEDGHFNREKDCLVIAGDLFDRGDKPLECLQYVMSLPHKILLFGNHELELKRLIRNGHPTEYDFYNMTADTLLELAGVKDYNFQVAANFLRNLKNDVSKLLDSYFKLCHYAAVFDDYVVTHSWLPTKYNFEKDAVTVVDGWETSTTESMWYDTCWANAINRCSDKAFLDGKCLIVGHTHSWRVAQDFGNEARFDGDNVNSDPYAVNGTVKFENGSWHTTSKTALFIDGAAPYEFGGKVNLFIINSKKKPILVDTATNVEQDEE